VTEATLKSALVTLVRKAFPGYVIFRHEDRHLFGVPDLSVTGNGVTSWWEGKHANPNFKSQGIQELTMLRLANHSHARYIIWDENSGSKRTLVVSPQGMSEWQSAKETVSGFNHRWVVELIRKVHDHDNLRS
jgi:hypothetical protein